MVNDNKNIQDLEKKFISRNAELIEKVLGAFNLKLRVAEVHIEKEYIEYAMEIAIGTDLDELERHSRDLALATASPTGKVKMIIPIPGRSLVGIQIPRPTERTLLSMTDPEIMDFGIGKTWREKFAIGLFLLSKLLENIAKNIFNSSTTEKVNH